MSAQDRARRAEARRGSATLHRTTLQAVEDDLDPVEGPEAISLLTALSRESWSATGEPVPQYARRAIPVVFVHGRRE